MRKLLMLALAFGAAAGFVSGFAHMATHHHRVGCDWHAPAQVP